MTKWDTFVKIQSTVRDLGIQIFLNMGDSGDIFSNFFSGIWDTF